MHTGYVVTIKWLSSVGRMCLTPSAHNLIHMTTARLVRISEDKITFCSNVLQSWTILVLWYVKPKFSCMHELYFFKLVIYTDP
jgi:hypothetical protein